MQLLRRYALYLQGVMAAASEGQGGVAESFETVDDVLARCGPTRPRVQPLARDTARIDWPEQV